MAACADAPPGPTAAGARASLALQLGFHGEALLAVRDLELLAPGLVAVAGDLHGPLVAADVDVFADRRGTDLASLVPAHQHDVGAAGRGLEADRDAAALELGLEEVIAETRIEREIGPQESISLQAALDAMTRGAAYTLNLSDEMGSIEVGKSADLVVIDRDIFDIPLAEVADTKALVTVFRGQTVYEAELP